MPCDDCVDLERELAVAQRLARHPRCGARVLDLGRIHNARRPETLDRAKLSAKTDAVRQVTDPRPDAGQRVLPGAGLLAVNAHCLASLVSI